ncbi:SWIB/MDM2 domain-containing protein [Thiomonas sp.]|uniref:SWIB/MDM2 domain-containing protein n=1 Tax=Thiomonas sp. TaxID=2047785 RepID=UPI00260E65E3|nr:SWIB/MDM2 domain-containing protein [Thiomonas sp.]
MPGARGAIRCAHGARPAECSRAGAEQGRRAHPDPVPVRRRRPPQASHGVQDMATAKPAPAKKAAAKPARTPNAAFMKPLTPSPQLAAVVGAAPLPRTEVVKKVWEHIKAANLQDAANKRMINADDKLRAVFGKPQVTMFEMTKLINAHLK